MQDIEELTGMGTPVCGSEIARQLSVFLNEKWKDELGMKMSINTAHPEAEMDSFREHEQNMLRYELLFRTLQDVQRYKRALELLRVWSKCSTDALLPQGWPYRNGEPMAPAAIVNEALDA